MDGREGKSKGLLQVLWEHGWIDNTGGYVKKIPIFGSKNEYNVIQSETSIKHPMGSSTGFEEEATMLQSITENLHVTADRSNREIACEGINTLRH